MHSITHRSYARTTLENAYRAIATRAAIACWRDATFFFDDRGQRTHRLDAGGIYEH